MNPKPVATLKNWRYWERDDPQYGRDHVLAGEVIDHPRPYLMDGEPVTTSRIVGKQGELIETQNTCYRLEDWSGEGLSLDELLGRLEEVTV